MLRQQEPHEILFVPALSDYFDRMNRMYSTKMKYETF
ncbi:MAG: hypothetical protein ACI87E_005283 [Mariniblastus sp.]|jgi:hypothetical protein